MKKPFVFFSLFIITMISSGIFAQDEDDIPYLSDDDIAAMEMVLPDDIPDNLQKAVTESRAEAEKSKAERNEIARLNTSQTVYHLLILDRTYCQANSDIGGLADIAIPYKFKHRTNGYLIAVYKSPKEGPVFPQLPDNSRILADLATARKSTILEYINSSAFRRFVTSRKIISEIQETIVNSL
jgi:hypothetical protein